MGLGNAYVGLADDVNSVFFNPAGLALVKDQQVTSMYSTLLTDIRYLVLAGTQPLPAGQLGLGYIDVYSPPTPVYEIINNRLVYLGNSTQNNRLLILSYAKELQENLSLGASLKYFNFALTGGGATYESSGSGTELDLGLKFLPKKWVSLGLSLQNTLPSSLGGKFSWSDGTVEGIPARFVLGSAFRVIGKHGLREMQDRELDFTADFETDIAGASGAHFGVEFWPVYNFGARLGFDKGNLAMGASFKNKGFIFDYAYNRLSGVADNTCNSISISYVGEEEKQFTSLEREEPLKANEYVLKTFSDVPDGYFARDAIGKAASADMMSGYPDGTFKPDEVVTRGELALILVRALGITVPEVNGRFIKDLPPDYWAAPYAKAAMEKGLMTGYADDTFRPNWPVKLKEALVVMERFDPSFAKTAASLPFDTEELTRGELAFMLVNTDYFKEKYKGATWK